MGSFLPGSWLCGEQITASRTANVQLTSVTPGSDAQAVIPGDMSLYVGSR